MEQVETAFRLARRAGFDNINMDMILGLPGETAADVTQTVEAIKALCPDELTVHSLAVKRASRLSKWIEENGVTAYNNTAKTMEIAARGAADMGMAPYYLYEEKQTILALGAGSITKGVFPDNRIERCENVKDVAQYIERIDEMIERKRQLL